VFAKDLFILFIIGIVLLLTSCSEENISKSLAPPEAGEFSVYKTETEQIQPVLKGFGNLSFRHKADITAAVDGTIRTFFTDEGSEVESGEIVADIYNIQLEIRAEQAEASLLSVESALELAKTRYREGRLQAESRLLSLEKSDLNLMQKEAELEHQSLLLQNKKKLYALDGITEEELSSMQLAFSALETEIEILKKDIQIQKIGFRDSDISACGYNIPSCPEEKKELLLDINSQTLFSEIKVAEARVKSAVTELTSAEALLSETQLKSPIDGIVGARYMETGERAKSDSKIFTVFDSSEIDFVFSVPEKIGVMLIAGEEVRLSIDAAPDEPFTARIRLISPTIDPQSGNISIKAALDNNSGRLKPGMFARFSLVYGTPRKVLRIPSNSLVQKNGISGLVYKLNNKRVYPVSISLGNEDDGLIEVTDGLEEGDVIVLNPSPLLQEGDEINAK